MKAKFLLIAALTIITTAANAQIEGVEIGAEVGLGYIDGADKRINGNLGCNFGLTITNGFAGGLFFTHLNTNCEEDGRLSHLFDDCEFLYRSNYTGLYFKKIFLENSSLQFSAFVKGGIGGTNYSNHVAKNFLQNEDDEGILHEKADKCFVTVVEPGASIDYDLGGIVLSLGATYRKYGNLKLYCDGYKIASGNDLDGITVFFAVTLRTN